MATGLKSVSTFGNLDYPQLFAQPKDKKKAFLDLANVKVQNVERQAYMDLLAQNHDVFSTDNKI